MAAAPVVTGLHHVTAVAGDPARNVAFYRDVLGLRLVKQTVNFDDPSSYHLYFGDEHGSPGTLFTTFPHPRAKPGRHGAPEIERTVFAAEPGSLASWEDRLRAAGVSAIDAGERRLAFQDHDGMRLALEETADAAAGRIDRVAIRVGDADAAASWLTQTMGFAVEHAAAERRVLSIDGGGPGRRLELVAATAGPSALGAGVVHHVAWRVPDAAAQADASERLRAAGAQVTPVMDRTYFRSIYSRTPFGVIFEIATDGPGFAVDEPPDRLGTSLKLPPQHEPRRDEIERRLQPLRSARP